MSTCCVCHLIHSALLWGKGSEHQGLLKAIPCSYTSQRHLISSQELLDMGIKRGQALKVLLFWSGLIRWVTWSLFIPPGWQVALLSSGIPLGATFWWWLSKGYLLSWLRRTGDLGHLWAGSPWHDFTWETLVWWPRVWDLCQQLPEHLQLLEHWQLWQREQLNLSISSSRSAMATNACQWASLATARASLQEPCFTSLNQSQVAQFLVLVRLGVEPGDAGWAPSWFLPQQCRNLPLLEAFFDGVQDLLVDTLLHLPITEHLP